MSEAAGSGPADGPALGDLTALDPTAPGFVANPYPWYARLRSEVPAHFVASEGLWWITRYDDVVRALGDPRFGKESRSAVPGGAGAGKCGAAGPPPPAVPVPGARQPDPLPHGAGPPAAPPATPPAAPPATTLAIRYRDLPGHMLDRDPPAHTRLRALVSRAFTPKVVEALRPRIARMAEELLDRAERRREADVVRDFAFPLPATVIAELLGVPVADQDRFGAWSAAIVHGLDGALGAAAREAGDAAGEELAAYLGALAAERRARPRDDLISDLLAAEAEGDRLSAGEVLSMCVLLLIAGHETTSSLIGSGTLTLLRNPAATERLRDHPEWLPGAVEELLRFESPVQRFFRVVQAEVEVGGRPIPAGSTAMLVFAAANRDPSVFAAPDALDFTRRPNPHLAFGRGIHFCLGAPLARLEAEVAFGALLRRWGRLAVRPEDLARPRWSGHSVIRSLRALPVRFG